MLRPCSLSDVSVFGLLVALALVIRLDSAAAEISLSNTPVGKAGRATANTLPSDAETAPLDAGTSASQAAYPKVNVTGKWSDSYGYSWSLTQDSSGKITGTVTVPCPSPSWPVTGAVASNTAFVITAKNPTGGDETCNKWFRYQMHRASQTSASGKWNSSVGNTGSVTMNYVTPANFQQVGSGVQRPGGVLHFDYSWGSTSGVLADVANCTVGEYVKYPGSADPYVWPSPPYSGATPNPTITWGGATAGSGQDDHSPNAFLNPYVANTFSARQNYRYKCAFTGIVNFSGWVGIVITRKVRDTTGRGCWVYTITKSGASATRRLPGVTNADCKKSAKVFAQATTDFTASRDAIGMSVSLPRATAGLHEPVLVDLTVFNRTAKTIFVDLGLNRKANIELTVSPPGGGVERRTLSSAGFGRSGALSLPPGGKFVERLVLNEWYGFAQTGTYKIRMTLLDAASASNGDRASTDFSIQLKARDPAQIRRVAEALADRAIAGATVEERMEAANALSYVTDPVAVPSLVRVLQEGLLVEHYAVEGLGRIDNAQARAALLVAAQSHADEDVRAAAGSMLRALNARSQGKSRPAD